MIVVVGALILTMLFGSMSAYVLARFTFPGSRLLYYLMLAGLTFPIFLAIVPLFFVLRGIGLLNTLPGLILTYAAFAFPFTVFFLYAFFRSLSKSIAEAAAVDGAGEWRTFFQIMLPMAKPGLATVAILNFVGLWNQFLLPIALNTNPDNYVLTQAMASFASQAGYSVDFGALFAAVVITVVPVLIIYLIFQRQLRDRSRKAPTSKSQGTNKWWHADPAREKISGTSARARSTLGTADDDGSRGQRAHAVAPGRGGGRPRSFGRGPALPGGLGAQSLVRPAGQRVLARGRGDGRLVHPVAGGARHWRWRSQHHALVFVVVVIAWSLSCSTVDRTGRGVDRRRELRWSARAGPRTQRAPGARHPVLLMNLRSGGGKAERFRLVDLCRQRNIRPIVLRPE